MQERSVESDVLVAEVAPQVLSHLHALLADLYIPLVAGQQPACRQAESAKDEFVQVRREAGCMWVLGAQCCHALPPGHRSGLPALWCGGSFLPSMTMPHPSLPCWRLACPVGQGAAKFVSVLAEATAAGGGTAAEDALPLPPAEMLSSVVGHRGTAKSLTRAAADTELVARFSALLAGWCDTLEAALAAGGAAMAGKDAEDAGALRQAVALGGD